MYNSIQVLPLYKYYIVSVISIVTYRKRWGIILVINKIRTVENLVKVHFTMTNVHSDTFTILIVLNLGFKYKGGIKIKSRESTSFVECQ